MLRPESPCPRALAAGADALTKAPPARRWLDRFDRVVVDAAAHAGWPIGTVKWLGMLTASAVSFVLLLTHSPGVAAGLGLGLPMCAWVGHFLVSVMRS